MRTDRIQPDFSGGTGVFSVHHRCRDQGHQPGLTRGVNVNMLGVGTRGKQRGVPCGQTLRLSLSRVNGPRLHLHLQTLPVCLVRPSNLYGGGSGARIIEACVKLLQRGSRLQLLCAHGAHQLTDLALSIVACCRRAWEYPSPPPVLIQSRKKDEMISRWPTIPGHIRRVMGAIKSLISPGGR